MVGLTKTGRTRIRGIPRFFELELECNEVRFMETESRTVVAGGSGATL